MTRSTTCQDGSTLPRAMTHRGSQGESSNSFNHKGHKTRLTASGCQRKPLFITPSFVK
jgi:hypothetical protein